MPFIIYAEYQVGSFLLQDEHPLNIEFTMEWIEMNINRILVPLLAGSLFLGVSLSLICYYLVNWCWVKSVKRAYRVRQTPD
jgi:uncharacterized protein (DUF2062 family)